MCLSSWEATEMGEVPFFSALSCRSSYHTLDFATWSFPLSAPLPPNFFLSQLSKALRLAQYVCISRCVYAHIFHLSRICHLPGPFWWQVFWGWHFRGSCWHMQTSAMVKGKKPALEKNGCCRSGLRDISMWGNLAVPCLYHILLFPMPWVHLFHHYLKPFEVFIIFYWVFLRDAHNTVGPTVNLLWCVYKAGFRVSGKISIEPCKFRQS